MMRLLIVLTFVVRCSRAFLQRAASPEHIAAAFASASADCIPNSQYESLLGSYDSNSEVKFANNNDTLFVNDDYNYGSTAAFESVENSFSSVDSTKTPMCLLNELTQHHKLRIQHYYTEEGKPHERIFTVVINLVDGNGNTRETYAGKGSSIKKAKQAAAQQALLHTGLTPPLSFKNQKRKKNKDFNFGDINTAGKNPISILNECWQKSGIQVMYDFSESGPAHQKTFTVTCSFNNIRGVGVASKKKVAKRECAESIVGQMGLTMSFDLPVKTKKSKRKSRKNKNIKISQNIFESMNVHETPSIHKEGHMNKLNFAFDSGMKNPYDDHKDSRSSNAHGTSSIYDQFARFANSLGIQLQQTDVLRKNDKNYISLVKLPNHICYGEGLTMSDARDGSLKSAMKLLMRTYGGVPDAGGKQKQNPKWTSVITNLMKFL